MAYEMKTFDQISDPLLGDSAWPNRDVYLMTRDRRRTFQSHLVRVGVAFSILANFLFIGIAIASLRMPQGVFRYAQVSLSETQFAKLQYNVPRPIMEHSEYNGDDLMAVRKLWEDISIDDGMVALPDSYVEGTGLPTAQRFPWDETKGIYFINGFHSMHCLRAVHISLTEFALGEQQSRNFAHVQHCMEALRQDILCHADDTPRYTTADARPESGVGQVRQCRDWGRLVSWARENNACYKFINQTAHGFPNVLRYTYCPRDSPYAAVVKEKMGGTNLTDFLV